MARQLPKFRKVWFFMDVIANSLNSPFMLPSMDVLFNFFNLFNLAVRRLAVARRRPGGPIGPHLCRAIKA